MATVESLIPKVLFEHVVALTLSPSLPVSFPDQSFTKPDTAYLEVAYLPNTNVNLFLADDATVQHQGLLQITVVHPINRGVVKPNEIAGLIAAHFAKGTKLSLEGVRVRINEKPSVAAPIQETTRLRVPVTIPYQVFH